MKKELFVCDHCKSPICTGFVLKGGLHIIEKHTYAGGIAGGAGDEEYHYCFNCFNHLIRALKFPEPNSLLKRELEETKPWGPATRG